MSLVAPLDDVSYSAMIRSPVKTSIIERSGSKNCSSMSQVDVIVLIPREATAGDVGFVSAVWQGNFSPRLVDSNRRS